MSRLSAGGVEILIGLNDASARQKYDAFKRELGQPLTIPVRLGIEGAAGARGGAIAPEVKTDQAEIGFRRIRGIWAELASFVSKPLVPTIDTSAAMAQIAKLRAEVASIRPGIGTGITQPFSGPPQPPIRPGVFRPLPEPIGPPAQSEGPSRPSRHPLVEALFSGTRISQEQFENLRQAQQPPPVTEIGSTDLARPISEYSQPTRPAPLPIYTSPTPPIPPPILAAQPPVTEIAAPPPIPLPRPPQRTKIAIEADTTIFDRAVAVSRERAGAPIAVRLLPSSTPATPASGLGRPGLTALPAADFGQAVLIAAALPPEGINIPGAAPPRPPIRALPGFPQLPPPSGAGGAGGGGAGFGGGAGAAAGGASGALPPQRINIPNAPAEAPAANRSPFGTFYKRFLALEGIRLATDLAYAGRENNVRQTLAQGDPQALALSDVQLRTDIAGSLPFGIGKLALLMRDPFGREELGVKLPLQQASEAEKLIASRQKVGEYRLNLRESADAARRIGPAEIARGEVEDKYKKELLANQETTRIASQANTKAREQALAELPSFEETPQFLDRIHTIYHATPGTSLKEAKAQARDEFRDRVNREHNAIADANAKKDQQAQADITARRQAQLDKLGRGVTDQIAELKSQSQYFTDLSTGLSPDEAQLKLSERNNRLAEGIIARSPDPLDRALGTATADVNRQKETRDRLELSRKTTYDEIGFKTDVKTSILRGVGRPYEAQVADIRGQSLQAFAAADTDTQRIQATITGIAQEFELAGGAFRKFRTTWQNLADRSSVLDAHLRRDPIGEIKASIGAERREALEGVADLPFPLRTIAQFGIKSYFGKEEGARVKALDEFQKQRTGALALDATVTAFLAKREPLTAQVAEIAGTAELRAHEEELRTDETPEARKRNAGLIRQSGRNRVEAFKNNILTGGEPIVTTSPFAFAFTQPPSDDVKKAMLAANEIASGGALGQGSPADRDTSAIMKEVKTSIEKGFQDLLTAFSNL